MADRSQDWLRQAERDLEHARLARSARHHEWCCFIAQQAAEKAVTALHLSHGQETWGRVVAKLIAELPPVVAVPADLPDKAHVLDAFYVAPRYPSGHPEGAPFEHYGNLQSEEAIRHAGAIIEFVRTAMA